MARGVLAALLMLPLFVHARRTGLEVDLEVEGAATLEMNHRLRESSISLHESKETETRIHTKHSLHSSRHTATDAKHLVGDPVISKTEHSSFTERMTSSFFAFIGGCILLTFSVPILWLNERRGAQMESLIAQGKSDCRSVNAVSDENRHWLVHVPGEHMRAAEEVSDGQFKVSLASDCVRLRSEVEVYQVLEEEHKETREKLGGGKETVTTYKYHEAWSNSWHNSNIYKDRSMDRNRKPEGLELGTFTQNCPRVELGEAFLLTEDLVQQCQSFEGAGKRLQDELQCSTHVFKRHTALSEDEDSFFCSVTGASTLQTPAVGDARVRFTYVPDGVVTVLALQAEAQGEERDTFLPYRVISRGWCRSAQDEEKRLLRIEAEKTGSQLAKQAGCIESLACICCACDLVMKFFAGALTPEIYHLLMGKQEQGECFKALATENRMKAWMMRVIGWFMMFVGLHLLFSPFLTLLVILPFVGPWLSSFGSGLIWFLSFFTTLIISSMIVILAYFFYRPIVAAVYALGTAVVVCGILALTTTGTTIGTA